jgi:hypothetical protein
VARHGLISEDQSDNGFFGFNIFTRQVYGPASTELMAYTGSAISDPNEPVWISDYSSKGIIDRLRSTGGVFPNSPPPCPFGNASTSRSFSLAKEKSKASPVQSVGGDAIFVSGSVSVVDNTGKFAQVYTATGPGDTSLPDSGTYTIRFERGGQILATYLFEPDVAAEDSTGIFDFSLPMNTQATRIVLLHNGIELDSRTASANAPTVNVTSPNGGETLGGSKATITWTAADPDGDPLSYIVQFSSDGGQVWQTVASHLTETSAELDLSAIGGTSAGLVRVLATDGFYTAHDESNGPFTIQPHAPQVTIRGPQGGTSFTLDQTVILIGDAFDAEDGQVGEAAISWSSNLDGPLGSGRSLAVNAALLSEGIHTITLTARDSDGQIGSAIVSILVSHSRPAAAPRLSLAPTTTNFTIGVGNIQTAPDIIAVRNNGDGTLNWSASADQPWIRLSATTGSAPANISVSADPTGLSAGQYTGHVTVITSDAPNSPQTINITLNVVAGPWIFLDADMTDRAAAIDSVTWVRAPFRILSNNNFSTDHHTRVMFLTSELGMTQPDSSTLTVSAGGIGLTVENVGSVGMNISYIIVRLPDGLPAGDLPLRITLRGVASVNSPTLSISP